MIGKFNSAEELLKSYNELEKSFTQKCQQLAALQKQAAENTDGTNEQSSPSHNTEDNGAAMEVQVACAVPADRDASSAANDSPSPQQTAIEQIKQYLDANPDARALLLEEPTVAASPPLPKVMASGGNVPLVLPTKPKTIKEASLLAKRIFDGV